MASRIAAPTTLGMASRIVRSIWVAGPEMEEIWSASSAAIVNGMMTRKKAMRPIDRLIDGLAATVGGVGGVVSAGAGGAVPAPSTSPVRRSHPSALAARSEEHTSDLQSL